ncbi:glutathione hydrolase 1 proenzyme isoform X2 [Lingula anatina]|nr:glutathione hydrolase 1 proenzyme isoform X2 [Lingula anatina]XP_013421786.1 glutathione hydrolase 1 proenzyme isoform X2 [Lingula anatina]|eukprot:XP_013421785.1 glutathione hydrolase 1 proenzyme isoform X2 [Lingula anatina]
MPDTQRLYWRKWDARSILQRRCILLTCLFLIVAIALTLAVVIALFHERLAKNPKTSDKLFVPPSDSILGKYDSAAVASDVEECSVVGKQFLKRGGTAIDGVIATLLCVGVHNIHSMGLGGGFFMVYYDRRRRKVMTIDAREKAPIAASKFMYNHNKEASLRGGLSIAVPGEIKGYWEAHQQLGRLPWSELFKPAIQFCRNGAKVHNALATALKLLEHDIREDPSLSEMFIDEKTGELLQEGDLVYNHKLADTLQTIADDGVDAMYGNHSLARSIVAELKDAGSIITERDLEHYDALIKPPLNLTLRNGMTVYTNRPPASGAVLSYIINILQEYNMSKADIATPEAAGLTYHRMVEAFKFAYAKRTELGDEAREAGLEDDAAQKLKQIVDLLSSKNHAAVTRAKINDDTTQVVDYYGAVFSETDPKGGTSHVSILDSQGDAVSVTSTINFYLGSLVRGNITGIVYNDEMNDFSLPSTPNAFGLPPSAANFIHPQKRPMSSMAPAILVDKHGDVQLVLGAAGGSKITSTLAEIIMRCVWFDEDIKQAVDYPRLHDQLIPTTVFYEKNMPSTILASLVERGHNMTLSNPNGRFSVVEGIQRKDGKVYANCDFRKGGNPAGY